MLWQDKETASKTFPLMAKEQVACEVQEEDHCQLVQKSLDGFGEPL